MIGRYRGAKMKPTQGLIKHLSEVVKEHGFEIQKVNFLNDKVFIMLGLNNETKKAQK